MVRVLLVEDEATLLKNIERSLRREGLDVLTARDCQSVQQVLDSSDIDILCLDIHLPDGDGLDLIEDARASSPGVTTIVMSSHVTQAHRSRALRLGVGDILEKPFRLHDLKVLLMRHIKAIESSGSQGPAQVCADTTGSRLENAPIS
jgi:DNA-binding response OmpR family regulator